MFHLNTKMPALKLRAEEDGKTCCIDRVASRGCLYLYGCVIV